MSWKKIALGCVLFVAVERFCYFQTGTFSLSKMIEKRAPPSPASASSPVKLQQPLRFIGAGKQFFAFETADGKYVVKFMKWSRRRPLTLFEKPPLKRYTGNYVACCARRAENLQKSSQLALSHLQDETQLVIPQEVDQFTLIDKLGIQHTVDSHSTHFYVQQKATLFIDYFESHLADRESLLQSYIHTVAAHCRKGILNLDPLVERNYGVVKGQVVLLDIGSLMTSNKLQQTAAIHQEIVLELLSLRAYLQKKHPEYLSTFDGLLAQKLQISSPCAPLLDMP